MKKILVISLLLLVVTSISAQERNSSYRKGYRADVEIGTKIYGKGIGNAYMATTSHGYSFGNGLYAGGGIGLGIETHGMLEEASADYSYPYVDEQTGSTWTASALSSQFVLAPRAGIELFNHLRLTVECRLITRYFSCAALNIGFAFGGGRRR
ncbi:MAG: hypothetical protein NC308_02450 [Clostridium sp.]|nr:hypothetical protein [Bacteroides sp.]MCM1197724.1 hypothetical protein [Clostridium sp.]